MKYAFDDRFGRENDENYSTLFCGCGETFRWEGSSDDLQPWVKRHQTCPPHRSSAYFARNESDLTLKAGDVRRRLTEVRRFLGSTLQVLDVQWFGVTISDPELDYEGELHNSTRLFRFTSEGLARLAFEWAYQCKLAELEARKGDKPGDIESIETYEWENGTRKISFGVWDEKPGYRFYRKWYISYEGLCLNTYEFIQ